MNKIYPTVSKNEANTCVIVQYYNKIFKYYFNVNLNDENWSKTLMLSLAFIIPISFGIRIDIYKVYNGKILGEYNG